MSGGYGSNVPEPEYAELTPIVKEINELSHKIAGTLAEQTAERLRITYLLNNMNEGLVVLDRTQKILIANQSARSFFGAAENPEGSNLLRLTHIPHIVEAVGNAAENGSPETFDFPSDDGSKILQLFVSPVTGGENGECRRRRDSSCNRRHRSATGRTDSLRVCGERLPRAQNAADLHQGLRRADGIRHYYRLSENRSLSGINPLRNRSDDRAHQRYFEAFGAGIHRGGHGPDAHKSARGRAPGGGVARDSGFGKKCGRHSLG